MHKQIYAKDDYGEHNRIENFRKFFHELHESGKIESANCIFINDFREDHEYLDKSVWERIYCTEVWNIDESVTFLYYGVFHSDKKKISSGGEVDVYLIGPTDKVNKLEGIIKEEVERNRKDFDGSSRR